MELLNVILKGGILVYVLFLLSIVALGFFLERYFFLKKYKINSKVFIYKVKSLIMSKKIEESIEHCDNTKSPVAHVIKNILKNKDLSYHELKDSIDNETQLQIYQLEKYTSVIGTIAAVSPLIGFLGTVTGMIKTFMAIENHTGQVDPSVLAGGIWEALVTTAVGLGIGILTLLSYNYLMTRIERFTFDIKQGTSDILEIIVKKEDLGHE